jgi:hypothetical protein
MTVNERLAVAGIADEYYRRRASGDLEAVNRLLAQVLLRLDESGMHHSLPDKDAGASE